MKNNRIKQIASLLLTLILMVGFSQKIDALDSSVTFDDNKLIIFEPGSIYTDTDLFDNFKGVMPGDVKNEAIMVYNKNTEFDYVNVYLRAITHDEVDNPLSTKVKESGENVASMKDFISKLSMKVYNGPELIFDASADQLDVLSDNVLLGRLKTSESLKLDVELKVPKDLGNDYQMRVGEIDWVFVIEGIEPIIPVPKPPSGILGQIRPLPDTGILGQTRPLPSTGLGFTSTYMAGLAMIILGLALTSLTEKKQGNNY